MLMYSLQMEIYTSFPLLLLRDTTVDQLSIYLVLCAHYKLIFLNTPRHLIDLPPFLVYVHLKVFLDLSLILAIFCRIKTLSKT